MSHLISLWKFLNGWSFNYVFVRGGGGGGWPPGVKLDFFPHTCGHLYRDGDRSPPCKSHNEMLLLPITSWYDYGSDLQSYCSWQSCLFQLQTAKITKFSSIYLKYSGITQFTSTLYSTAEQYFFSWTYVFSCSLSSSVAGFLMHIIRTEQSAAGRATSHLIWTRIPTHM